MAAAASATIFATAASEDLIKTFKLYKNNDSKDYKTEIKEIISNFTNKLIIKEAIIPESEDSKHMTVTSFITAQIKSGFNTNTGKSELSITSGELDMLSANFSEGTKKVYSNLSSDQKDELCEENNIKQFYEHLLKLNFTAAQIKSTIGKLIEHIGINIKSIEAGSDFMTNIKTASKSKSPSASKSPSKSKYEEDEEESKPNHKGKSSSSSSKKEAPAKAKKNGLAKLKSFISLITKDGFFNDDVSSRDLKTIISFLDKYDGTSFVKMCNLWKTLSVEDKKRCDDFYATFPENTGNKTEDKKQSDEAFIDRGVDAVALFIDVFIKTSEPEVSPFAKSKSSKKDSSDEEEEDEEESD